jgi:hypothetical protein
MGKRELLIAAVFVVLGFGVYQLTAPPSDGSSSGFSIGRVIDQVRREIRGQRATAEETFAATRPVPDTITEIRLTFGIGAVTIVGEDREDIVAEMHVRSTGYDEAEARRLARESILTFDEAGALLIIAGKFPVAGRQTPTLRLRVPERLGIRLDEKGNTLEISNVASVLIGGGRGESTIRQIAGDVTMTQRGSELTITDVGSLKLNTFSGVEARVSKVHGDATLTLQGGEFRGEEFDGGIQLESRNADVQFEKLENLKGPVRVESTGGEIVFIGLGAETRIDARRSEIRVDHAGGASLSIYSEGEETIELTVPPAGFRMDALAIGGDISLDEKLADHGLKRESSGDGSSGDERSASHEETRLTGSVRGGGPSITLRTNRGDIVVRSR